MASEAEHYAARMKIVRRWVKKRTAEKDLMPIALREDLDDFVEFTGLGRTKLNKWMKRAGLCFNKRIGRWEVQRCRSKCSHSEPAPPIESEKPFHITMTLNSVCRANCAGIHGPDGPHLCLADI